MKTVGTLESVASSFARIFKTRLVNNTKGAFGKCRSTALHNEGNKYMNAKAAERREARNA